MKRSIGWGIVAAAAIFSSGILRAEPQSDAGGQPSNVSPPPRPRMPAGSNPMAMAPQAMSLPSREMLQQAGATDAQIDALTEFRKAQTNRQNELSAAAEKATRALMQLMGGTNVDEQAVFAAADAVTQARGEIFKSGLSLQLKTRQILGDEVMAKLREMRPQGSGRPAARSGEADVGGRALQMRSPLTPIRDAAPQAQIPPPPPPPPSPAPAEQAPPEKMSAE